MKRPTPKPRSGCSGCEARRQQIKLAAAKIMSKLKPKANK